MSYLWKEKAKVFIKNEEASELLRKLGIQLH